MKDQERIRKVSLDTLIQMRQSGASLRQISDCLDISREWVRQLLIKHRGSTRVQDFLEATELARQAGCSQRYIRKLRRRGLIRPVMVVGNKRTLWKPETVNTVVEYNTSDRCRVCNGPLPDNRWVYCSRACYIQACSDRYKRMSDQAKRLQKARVARWQRNHPERVKDIVRRGQRKYAAKKSIERYESRQYIIWKRCLVPLGTVVKIPGCGTQKGRLKVEWGNRTVEVPFCSVKRIVKESETVRH